MGAFLEKPKTDKEVADGHGHNLRWGVSAMQGWRLEMEDAHTCSTDLKREGWSFFAVFDGHAGPKVSEYCSKNLLDKIQQSLEPSDKEEQVSKKIKEAFLNIDDDLMKLNMDGRPSGGTTAVSCMVSPDKLIWANCGDSRGLLCSNNQLKYNTVDHKPMNEKEKLRIEKAGGTVMMQRVNGSLAVSRALGDFDYKRSSELKQSEQLVSPEPDMYTVDRSPEDQFLLLACDGVYDVMTNQEIIEFVLRHLRIQSTLSSICNDLIDTCLNKVRKPLPLYFLIVSINLSMASDPYSKSQYSAVLTLSTLLHTNYAHLLHISFTYVFLWWSILQLVLTSSFSSIQNSRDNMSVILVTFPNAPTVSEAEIEKVRYTEHYGIPTVYVWLKISLL